MVKTAKVLVVAEVIEQWQSEVIMIQIRELSLILKSLGALVIYFWNRMDFWWKKNKESTYMFELNDERLTALLTDVWNTEVNRLEEEDTISVVNI